jgi:phosphoribosylformylglycinamidine synthase subunit PurL
MGLSKEEYDLIVSLLEREPSLTELGMFAVMWSEHCGYKCSRPVLAMFKRYKEALEGKGFENAGVVELGDGLGVTMKVESHNHPSAVEPYQGAATGVGGIIRDILMMGARPIASLNSLRFGPIRDGEGGTDQETVLRNRYLFEHVVAGIAGYGNCVGVPTVAGEVAFHSRYNGNPLVNAMCVGILNLDDVTTAEAAGVGNPVLYLGSATGKDGIHGATFASDTLGEDNEAKRPNVQIGDPFAEKLVIEATLEALKTGAVVAIQDMGAAGLTCSTIEMASKGKVGMDVDLDLVPKREDDMSAYELMLSESQERMLAVAHKGREEEVLAVFRKWGVHGVIIGHVTDDGLLTVRRNGKIEAHLSPLLLTDHCPTYYPEVEIPEYHKAAKKFDIASIKQADPQQALLKLLTAPNIASKRWVYEQYDQQVQTQTSVVCGQADAAVLAPRGTKKGLSLKIDGNGRQTYFAPYIGGLLAVAEAARNVACTGANPVAITDCLNFGTPSRPHVFWQFREAVKGIAEGAETMETPVISGNVSFYNECDQGEVLPTPGIGMLGIIDDVSKALTLAPAKGAGELVLIYYELDEDPQDFLGASEYLAEVHGVENGCPAAPVLTLERDLCNLLVEAADNGWIRSAHDLSEGGLAVAAAEIAMACPSAVEFNIELGKEPFGYSKRVDAILFGETPGRVVAALPPHAEEEGAWSLLNASAEAMGLRVAKIGAYGASGDGLKISVDGEVKIKADRESLKRDFDGAIEKHLVH